ncbi:hypothetical protein BDV25DRAFT_140666 [Aspergillus avenaceus]|uniref:Nucleosome assembly protein n=1 Tax=Aspergillus avenaceus TaxID=36643 RepID=A0A5N6TTE1_ASPAV|nr:hypothetical protein BDV25DRAFT_140666 [Aspergillus avenaceus]
MSRIRTLDMEFKDIPPEVLEKVKEVQRIGVAESDASARFLRDLHELKRRHYGLNKDLYKTRSAVMTGLADDLAHEDEVGFQTQFWAVMLRRHRNTRSLCSKLDRKAMYLIHDITVEWAQGFDFSLIFHFPKNKFFQNRVIRKSFFHAKNYEPERYPKVTQVRGDRIVWKKDGKELANLVNGLTAGREGRSFFHWLTRKLSGGTSTTEQGKAKSEMMEADARVGMFIRDNIIPLAMYYHPLAVGSALELGIDCSEFVGTDNEGENGSDGSGSDTETE